MIALMGRRVRRLFNVRSVVSRCAVVLMLGLVALVPAAAFAQTAQTTVTITGSTPANYFTGPGQTLTFNLRLYTGNTEISGLSFTSGSPTGMSPVSCPPGIAPIATNVTCTFTYTTTSTDVALGRVTALGRWTATRPTGANRSGTTNTYVVSYVAPSPAPTVSSLSPTSGALSGGNTVLINGTGLAWASAVTFGGTPATFTVLSDSQIQAVAPAGAAGTVDVQVTTPSGTSATSAADHYTYVPPPSVTAISPPVGPVSGGTTVTLTGTQFTGVTGVFFGATAAAAYTVNSPTQITATSPAGTPSTVDVRVQNASGMSASIAADQFTYLPAPTVTAISPSSGPASGGTTVTLTGTNFAAATAVTFGATPAIGFTVSSNTSIVATAPAGTGTADVRVTSPGGTSATSPADQYTWLATPVANNVSATVAYGSSNNPITLNVSGGAPTGIGIATPPAHGTVTVSGLSVTYTPQSNYSGADTFSYTASNASGTSAAATVTLTVAAPTLVIDNLPFNPATVGQAYSRIVTTTGGSAPYAYSISSGALPAGLTLAANGTLSGTPTAAGTFNFDVRVQDSSTGTGAFFATRSVTLQVLAPTVVVAPPSLGSLEVGAPYTATITATGGTAPYTFSVSAGALPAGLTLASNGTLSGTPTASGTFNFTLRATDSTTGSGPYTGARAYSVVVAAPVLFLSPASGALPDATAESAFSQTFTASGGTAPFVYSVVGTLPAGLSFNTSTGTLSGTPTVSGVFNFSVRATDATTGTGAPFSVLQAYSLNVVAPNITLAPASLGQKTVGVAINDSLSAAGGVGPYTFGLSSGALPAGVTLSSSGILSGTPVVSGSFPITVSAQDSHGFTGTAAYTVVVVSPVITLAPATVANGTVAAPYSQTVSASGGTSPYTYALTSGALPPGLTLAGGTLSGTPTAAGNYAFTITATDSFGSTGSQAYAPSVASGVQIITNLAATPAAPVFAPGGTFTVSATPGASTSALVFSSTTPAVCSVTGTTVSMLSAGSCGIAANQAGDANYTAAAQVDVSVVIAQATQTITGFTANPAAPVYAPNGTFTVSATAGASTSPLVFASTTPLVCSVTGNTVTVLAAGNCALTANQTGDANYLPATQVGLTVGISAASQVITQFVATPAAPVYAPGGTFNVSATPGASTAALVFASATPAVCSVSGTRVTMLSAGACALTANQAGDANYTAAPQVNLNVTISAAAQAITGFAANPSAPVFTPNGTFALSATAGASSSPIVYASSTQAVCTVSGNTVTMLSAGQCALTANQAGDGNYTAAPQVGLNVVIGAANQTITHFVANPSAPVFAANGTFTVSATPGASVSPLVFASTSPAACTVAGNTVTMVSAGNCVLTANQAGDGNYVAATPVSLTVVIAPSGPQLTWVGTLHKMQGEAAFELPAPVSNSPGAFTYTSSNTSVASVSGRTVTLNGSGTTTLTATQAATANYKAGSITMTLIVDARPDPSKDPSVTAGLQAQLDASLRFANAQQGNVLDRLRQLRASEGTPSHDGLTLNMTRYGAGGMSLPLRFAAAPLNTETANTRGTWTGGSITYGRRSTLPGRDGYELRSDGISVGTDRAFGDFVVGGALGMGWGRTEFEDTRSRQDARQRAVTLYGLWRGQNSWYLEGLLGYGELDFDLRRWSAVANAMATAKRKGNQQFGSLGLGYTHSNARMDLTGYGRLEANRTELDAYRETGLGIYDLGYRKQGIDSSLVAVGVEGSFNGKWADRTIRPFWSLEYRNALSGSEAVKLNYVIQPNTTDYQVSLRGFADRMWALGGGFDYDLGRGWNLSLMYRHEQANRLQNNTVGLRLVFGGAGR